MTLISHLRRNRNSILVFLATVIVIVGLVQQYRYGQQDTLGLLQAAEPSTDQYRELDGAYPTYELTDTQGDFVSYAVITTASGYGGPLTLLTLVSQSGYVEKVVLLDHVETPLYMKKVLKNGYPEILHGRNVAAPLLEHAEVEVVNGATITTEAIILAVEKGMYQVAQNQLGMQVPQVKQYHFQWQDAIVTLLLLTAIIAVLFSLRRLRPWILIISFISIGFVTNSSLTIGNFVSIIANKMPGLFERPMWYVLIMGVIVSTAVIGKNIYCGWLCPFGAAQEGIYKALHLVEYRPDQRFMSFARKYRWLFIWLAVVLALSFHNPGIASYEPFAVFFSADGNTAQWVIMGIVLLLSIFVLRFWCRYFCPVGTLLDFIARIKWRVKKWTGKQPQHHTEHESVITCQQQVSACSECHKQQIVRSPMGTLDKVLVLAMASIFVSVVVALLQNILMNR